MPLPFETDPIARPPMEMTPSDKTNLVAFGVAAFVVVVLTLPGLDCAVHRIGSQVAFLMS